MLDEKEQKKGGFAAAAARKREEREQGAVAERAKAPPATGPDGLNTGEVRARDNRAQKTATPPSGEKQSKR